MSSIYVQIFGSIDVNHKELSLLKKTDFKIEVETLDTWISFIIYPNDLKFLSHIQSFMIYKIPNLQIQKSSNKGDMLKKPNLTKNFQKLIILTKQILFLWNFDNRSFL